MSMNPQDVAQKWATRLSGAVQDIQRGIQRLTVSPTERAAQKRDKWIAELQRAANEGRWEAGLRAVTLEEWRNKMNTIGIARIPDGARSAVPKMTEFYNQLLPYVQSLKQRIEQMPDTTLEQRIQRAVEFIRGMSQFSFRRGGGGAPR